MSIIEPIVPGGIFGGGGPITVVPGPPVGAGGDSTGVAVLILKKICKDEDFDFGLALVSLHTGPPGLDGDNEVTGGSYVRKSSIGWSAAFEGMSSNTAAIEWTSGFPLVTVTHAGLWSNDGLTFIQGIALDLAKTITSGAARFAAGALRFSMSDRFSDYLANLMVDYILQQTPFTTAPVWGSIHTGALTSVGGTEVTGGTYARQELAIASWAEAGILSDGDTLLSLLYGATATWDDVPISAEARVGLWDAVSAGNFLMWCPDLALPATSVTTEINGIAATLDQTP